VDWQRASRAGVEARRNPVSSAVGAGGAAGAARAGRPPVAVGVPAAVPARKPTKAKLSYKDARELAMLPDRIQALETEQAAIAERVADGSLYASALEEAKALHARLEAIDAELTLSLQRWEELEARQVQGG